ncbi:hypothetical protein B0T22DRAFT_132829 [Podospora appendiculata]|uniref:Transcription factor tau subunit sfc6 n=1 Tax=Podospora appendiculata TaxID=314037 RepID=A0AAE1CBN0_9PEZI|nr:hypothetical protein B0T22DRAFT_132829 [Podospora appendiculata]
MRLRQTRGIRKNYIEAPIIYYDDENDGNEDEHNGRVVITISDHSDDDFDAQAGEQQAEEEDDDADEDVQIVEPEPDSEDEDDEAMQDGDPEGSRDKASPRQRKTRNTGAGMIQSRRGFHDIPQYPLETRIVTRVYAGPLRRYARYSALRDAMYGPEYQRIKIIWDLEMRWANFPVLPPRFPPQHAKGVVASPWLAPGFEQDQDRRALHWYDDYAVNSSAVQSSHFLPPKAGQRLIPRAGGDLVTFVGPYDAQKEVRLAQGCSASLSTTGLPINDPDVGDAAADDPPAGWMLDIGGLPLAMGWAPSASRDVQVLAIAAVPFADQELGRPDDPKTTPEADSAGSVQLWEFAADADQKAAGLAVPSACPPRLLHTVCFNWGRPKRLQWCPVPFSSADIYGMLAVLCGDGKARVIEVRKMGDDAAGRPQYEYMDAEMVVLNLSEYNVTVTCLSWVNINRIVLGHSDGSVTLWSLYPRKLLQRVGVHTTYVIDICSAYPSNPYLVASVPVGGCATLTDLSQPSSELTYFPVPAISFQHNMLCWNEPMQGFMALYPSSTPNTTIAFLHHRYFCQARSISTGPNMVTCISTGSSHPTLLMGCADGSVFACNALQKLFKQKGEMQRKIKIFEHEYRPVGSDPPDDDDHHHHHQGEGRKTRGAVRILHGFLPEPNDDPRTEKRKELDRKKRMEKEKKKGKGKKTARGGARRRPPDDNDREAQQDDLEAELDDRLASRVVTHEPLTRVTTMAWNPNLYFSTWAACTMASGLLKVMDLGVQ